jgi:hypothetical protein
MRRYSSVATVAVALLLVLSASAAPVAASHPGPASIPDDQVVQADPGVYVWERSVFPLRVGLDGAATAVPVGDLRASVPGTGEASLNKDPMGVVNAGEPVTLTFDDARASEDLGGTEVTVVAARVTGDVPTTVSGAVDLLSAETANEDATFEVVEEDVTLDGGGSRSFTHSPDAPGNYVYFATASASGEGVEVTGGELSLASEVTVLGVDRLTAQRGPAAVDAPGTVVAGEEADFRVDTSTQLSGDVTHVLAVYEEETFSGTESYANAGSSFTFVVEEGDVDDGFSLADAELRHSIGDTVGVAHVDDGISVGGVDLSDGRVARSVGLGGAVDFVVRDLEADAPSTTATGDETLYASVRGVADDDPATRIGVETFGNWSTGTYRYVYVAKRADNDSAVSTATGTFRIAESSDAGGGGGGGGGGGVSSTATRPQATDTIDPTTGRASVTFLDTDDVHMRGVSVDLEDGTSGEIAVVANAALPPGDPGPAGRTIETFDVTVPESHMDTPGTLSVRIPKNRLGSAADSPSQLVVSRYRDGAWSDLDTAVASTTGDAVTLEVNTPGFGFFAIRVPGVDGTVTRTSTPAGPTDTPAAGTPTPTPIPPPGEPGDVTTGGAPTEATDGGPGIGTAALVGALVVLVVAGALAWRYRN